MSAATYPVATIAKLLLLTERRVQQLTREGVLPRADRGRYELAPVVQAYVRYLRDRMLPSEAGLRRENGTATQTNEAEEEREAEPDPQAWQKPAPLMNMLRLRGRFQPVRCASSASHGPIIGN